MVKDKKKLKHDFLEFWKSETTRNLLTLLSPFIGYLTLVPLSYKIEQHLKDEYGRPQIRGFGGNFTVLYSSAAVTNMIAGAGKALGVDIVDLVKVIK